MNRANVLARQGLSAGTGLFESAPGRRIVLPFRRSAVAILIVAVMAVIMSVPAVGVFSDAAGAWTRLDGLFDLTTALFLSGWLLGWSVGLFILYALVMILWFGRETLVLRPGCVEIRFGLPVLFIRFRLDPGCIHALRRHVPERGAGTSWRGPHLAFDYDGSTVEVGSDISPASAQELAGLIRALPPRTGAAPDGHPAQTESPLHDAARDSGDPAITVPAPVCAQTERLPVSILALIAANLVPVAGVLLLHWDLGRLMVLFWAESGIIGVYNLLKIAVVQRWGVLITGAFFLGHFGAFMAVHFLFVYELFVARDTGPNSTLADVGQFLFSLWPALLALTLSHGLSFFYNFLGRGEYRTRSFRDQMAEPYGRIMIMHVTLLVGGGLTLLLGSPVAALLLLVALKIGADITAHRQQHRLR